MAELPPADPGPLIISGLRREAAIFGGPDAISICGDSSRLRAKLAQLADVPLGMVVSFGICGGLDPTLRRGDLVMGTEIVSGHERIMTDAAVVNVLGRRLVDAGERVVVGGVAGADAPVLTVEAKAQLRAATGAIAVDMESLIAGRVARERGVPFAILRAVSDPADRDLPPLVLKSVGPDGETLLGAAIRELIRSPGQLSGLVATARDSAFAFRTLGRCRRLPGLFLGLGLANF